MLAKQINTNINFFIINTYDSEHLKTNSGRDASAVFHDGIQCLGSYHKLCSTFYAALNALCFQTALQDGELTVY